MTDLATLTNTAIPHLESSLAVATFSSTPKTPNGAAALDVGFEDEESYTIKCVCDYDDDDGNTVQCEQCLTWQHIACYYPSYPNRQLPDHHNCSECDPSTPFDRKRANERQRQKRAQDVQPLGDRKVKRPTGKSHKKKAKEYFPGSSTNGWPFHDRLDVALGQDRKGGSPRDHPPPAKKPKISHRASTSVNLPVGVPMLPISRQREGSRGDARQSPSRFNRFPDSCCLPNNYYSPEFISLHRNKAQFVEAHANFYLSIGVSNSLSTWLDDPDALAEATNGRKPQEIFLQCTQPIEDIPMPQIVEEVHESADMVFHGQRASWHYLTVPSGVAECGFVGELRGQVGRLEDYKSDPANRWESLRHPEPFVFFHPQLPIYIDARSEGNILRHVGRSCNPNLEWKTIITEGREYRFCFVAKKEILPNEEITIGWNVEPILPSLSRLKAGNCGQVVRENVCGWVEGVLANFGGCACDKDGTACNLAQFDGRAGSAITNHESEAKGPKARKGKKYRGSPISTDQATNSRSGSEALLRSVRQCGENENSPSRSGSCHSKSHSREVTPMTHTSADGVNGVESGLLDRESRKMLKEQLLFEKLEQEQKHGRKKKKRDSGGLTINTPSVDASKQLGHLHLNGSSPNSPDVTPGSGNFETAAAKSESGSPSTSSSRYNEQLASLATGQKTLGSSKNVSPLLLVDSSIQTEPDKDDIIPSAYPPLRRKPFVPLKQRLLMRCQLKAKHSESESASDTITTTKLAPDPRMPPPPAPLKYSPATSSTPLLPVAHSSPAAAADVEMKEADTESVAANNIAFSDESHEDRTPETSPSVDPLQTTDAPPKPPRPPWPPSPPALHNQHPLNGFRSAALHVQLPPLPQFGTYSSITPLATSTPVSEAGMILQSPVSIAPQAPMFSPAVISAVTPSPAKKKLSLSDYTKRKKTETPAAEKDKSVFGYSPTAPSFIKAESSLVEEGIGKVAEVGTTATTAVESYKP